MSKLLSEKIIGYAQEIDGYTLAIDVAAAGKEVAKLEFRIASLEADLETQDLIVNEIPSTIYENILERLGMELEDE